METKTVAINGSKVRYLYGGTGKPLLFLHGWPSNPLSYKQALTLLAQSFTVYAPFMFDANCSSVSEIAEAVRRFCHELNIRAAAVAGVSFGGAVAAMLSPDKKLVSRLVLINPAGVPREASFAKMLVNLLKSSTGMLLKGEAGHFLSRYMSALNFFALLKSVGRRRLFAEIKASTKTHICYIFQRIPVKTAIIWCSRDDVFPVSAAAVLNRMIRKSKLTIVEGDHYWPFHEPGQFAETVLAHVK